MAVARLQRSLPPINLAQVVHTCIRLLRYPPSLELKTATGVIELYTTHNPSMFPQEIYDILIGNLGRAADLASCSLVCRSWTHSSRRCLFKDLRIQASLSNDFLEFRKYLESAQHIPQYVQYIMLIGQDTDVEYRLHQHQGITALKTKTVLCPTLLTSILSLLPALRALVLEKLIIQQQSPDAYMPRFVFQLAQLSLRHIGTHAMKFDDLVTVLALFRRIDALELKCCSLEPSGAISCSPQSLHPDLVSSVHLQAFNSPFCGQVLDLLRATFQRPTILDVECASWGEIASLAKLVDFAGDSLCCLDVEFTEVAFTFIHETARATQMLRNLNLQRCRRLTTLELHLIAGKGGSSVEDMLPGEDVIAFAARCHWWATTFLLSTGPVGLVSVIIRVMLVGDAADHLEDRATFNWPELERSLGRFGRLSELRFIFGPWEKPSDPEVYLNEVSRCCSTLRRMLPVMVERHLLVFGE